MYKFSTYLMRVFVYAFMTILLIVTIIPIWILIVNATRSTLQIQQGLGFFPSVHTLANYRILIGRGLNLPRGFANSLFLSITSTVVVVYFGLLTAYGIAAYNFPGKKIFYNSILVLVMIPMQLSIIGFYQYMSRLGLTDSYIPLIIPGIASAGAVFFFKQYLDSIIIHDLIDAARIDGAGEFTIFNMIMLPIAAPGAFTMGIFAFVASWNNFFTPFILITSLKKYTLPMLIQTLRGDVYRTEYGSIYLGLAITIVPVLIIYALFSKYIIQGIAMGAVKD